MSLQSLLVYAAEVVADVFADEDVHGSIVDHAALLAEEQILQYAFDAQVSLPVGTLREQEGDVVFAQGLDIGLNKA